MTRKQYGMVVVVALVAGWAGGSLSEADPVHGAVPAEQGVPKVIEAREFRLVDEEGTLLAGLGTDEFGTVGLSMYDPDGRRRVYLASSAIGSVLMLHAQSSQLAAALGSNDESADLVMGLGGHWNVVLSSTPEEDANLVFFDEYEDTVWSALPQEAGSDTRPYRLGSAIMLYRKEHQGQYPPDLEVLYEKGMVPHSCVYLFVDPFDHAPKRLPRTGLECSFEYVGPIPESTPDDTITIYSRKGIHPGKRAVLYSGDACESIWVTESLLGHPQGPFAESYRAVVKAYGDKLTPERDAELREFYEIDEETPVDKP